MLNVDATGPAQVRTAWRRLQEVPKLRVEFKRADFNKWCTVVESILADANIPDDLGLNLIIPMLPPEAKKLTYEGACMGWTETREVLRRHMFERNVYSATYLDILEAKQFEKETLREFAGRIDRLAALTPPDFNWPNTVLVGVFSHGVANTRLREALVKAEVFFGSLDEAVQFAEGAENEFLVASTSEEEVAVQKTTADALDSEILHDILEILLVSRRTRTIRDYKRFLRVNQAGLTDEERKNVLDLPTEDTAEVYFVVEMIPWFFPWGYVMFGRPLFTYTAHIPRFGRLVAKLNDGKPIIAPGRWFEKARGWLRRDVSSKPVLEATMEGKCAAVK